MSGKGLAMQKGVSRGGKGFPETASSSRQDTSSSDMKNIVNNIPIVRIAENPHILPKYTAILSRGAEEGVNMEDLDQLQLDLEQLLSTCAVRNRFMRSETDNIDRVEERRDRKSKSYDKGAIKLKRTEAPSKGKDFRNGGRPVKRHYAPSVDPSRHELPKINRVKNDTSDKFWATVEPHCAPINNTHIMFLDKLIEECSQEFDMKIPELGSYYANEWTDGAVGAEQELGTGTKTAAGDIKKNGISAVVNTFSNPKTQRLLAMLIDERVMNSFPNITASDLGIAKGPPNVTRTGFCTDRTLIQNLIDQGILGADDLPDSPPGASAPNSTAPAPTAPAQCAPQDDEILQEIRRCQRELATVNEYNVDELNRLRTMAVKDVRRQELKRALEAVDRQVLELYARVMKTKEEYVQEAERKNEKWDRETLTLVLREYEAPTDALLRQQTQLQQEIDRLQD